jgi:uncharacterized protein (TIGR02466 family)
VNFYNIFPTTIGMFNLERDLTKEELDFLNNQDKRPNSGNTTSIDNYVLKKESLKDLNSFFVESINKYFDELYQPKYDASLYITQSWVNYTEPRQWHHKHQHPNSFISGVFYVNADITKDRIYFYRDRYEQMRIIPREFNVTNSESWWFEAGTGRLILFPSSLTHMVEMKEHEGTRISLSFNTFLKGTLGDNNNLTELILGDQ